MNKDSLINIESLVNQFNFNITKEEIENYVFQKIIGEYMKKDHIFDSLTETVIISLYLILILFGIVSNAVIISVIATSKKLKTSNNILLINLFVSDLLLCIFCMPFTLIAIIRRGWTFGSFMCKFVPFIQAVTTFVSSATISSIALDRMIQITANQLTGNGISIFLFDIISIIIL
jgi:hypothetical protein